MKYDPHMEAPVPPKKVFFRPKKNEIWSPYESIGGSNKSVFFQTNKKKMKYGSLMEAPVSRKKVFFQPIKKMKYGSLTINEPYFIWRKNFFWMHRCHHKWVVFHFVLLVEKKTFFGGTDASISEPYFIFFYWIQKNNFCWRHRCFHK